MRPAPSRVCEDQCDKSSVGQSHVKNSGRPSLNERRSISFVLRGVRQQNMYIFLIFHLCGKPFSKKKKRQKTSNYGGNPVKAEVLYLEMDVTGIKR